MEIGGHRLTERAKLALRFAQESAVLSGGIVGTEHILLGLAKVNTGIAAGLLAVKGVNAMVIEDMIEKYYSAIGTAYHLKTDFAPQSKSVLEISVDEAQRFNDNFIGTEHILLSLLREENGLAAKIFRELGINEKEFYCEVQHIIDNTKNTISDKNVPKIPASLLKFGTDISKMAEENRIDPVIGRENEIYRVLQILCRRTKNNPVLIGEPGVGKTAVAEGIALKIAKNDVPPVISQKRLFALDIASMIAGAKYRGEFEERIKKALSDIKKAGNIILFIDEMHTLIGAGAAEGAIDAANILKPILARSEIQIIGATTTVEYRKYVEKDPALERRFQTVKINEPSENTCIEILRGIKSKYEAHHNVNITDEALTEAVKLSVRYIPGRFLPDKAIDLIDETASAIRMKSYSSENKHASIYSDNTEYLTHNNFNRYGNTETAFLKTENIPLVVTANDIAAKTAEITNIPVNKITKTESEKLLSLEETLHKYIIGQHNAVNAVSSALRRSRSGLRDPLRPIGSFIFAGPTGVGKTELSKAIASVVFENRHSFIKLDMSEYSEKHSVSKLIGSPPGYIGFENGGILTENVYQNPYSVILFDEIEKAHSDIFNILLQIMNDGILTDSHGRHINFKNTVIIMTSNIGAELITENRKFGFSDSSELNIFAKSDSAVLRELKKHFRPEFLNRIDDIIVFNKLNQSEIRKISRLLLDNVKQRLKNLDIECEFSDDTVNIIAEYGFNNEYGARPLKRAVQTKIEDMLSTELLSGNIKKGDKIFISADKNCILTEKIVDKAEVI